MENIQRFCGLKNNGSFVIWDDQYGTFGRCFLWTTISYSCNAVLAIICAYCFGISRKFSTRGKSFLVIMMDILPLLLAVTSVTELVISYIYKHEHPPAYVLSKTLSFSSWLFCFCVQFQIHALNPQKKEVTKYISVASLFITGSMSMQLHYIIKHILRDNINLKHGPAEYISIIVFFSLNVLFFLVCIIVLIRKSNRTYFNRSLPSLTENAPSIQASSTDISVSGETSDSASLITSPGLNQNIYYDIYTQRKKDNTDVYLGKAESKNIFSQLFFLWSSPLISKGYHYQLNKPDDLFILPGSLDTNLIKEMMSNMLTVQKHQSFMKEMKTDLSGKGNNQSKVNIQISLVKAFNKAFGKFYYSLGILKFLYDCCGFAGPILLNLLVMFMENKEEPIKYGYYYALGICLSTLLTVLMGLQYQYYINKVGLQVRASLITSIYEKTLSVNTGSLSFFTSGQVINLMSTDSDRVVNFCNSFHEFWSMPFQVAICLYLLYKQVGLAFLTGLGFIILLIPINRCIANKIGDLSKEMMKQKDERVQTMSELLFGIRVIKMFAWEQHFQSKIDKVRKMELKSLKGRKYLDALCVYFWATTPVLISVLTFVTYILLGNELTAAKVFTSIALFNMLIGPLNAFPWVLNGLMEAWVSLKRIEEFLCLPEIKKDDYYIKTSVEEGEETAIEIENGCFYWQKKNEWTSSNILKPDSSGFEIGAPFKLRNISFYVKKGQFVGISGNVAAGKSSLFASITAELEKYKGKVYVPEDFEGFGYVTQESWIQHMSIKDNILFGSPYDSERYQEVLFACALNEDLSLLPAKDLTEVGENGVNLSGGQKARIALARAVYQDKDIYLLDDPIAAVDVHVANHIFKHCIMGLLKDKTRLLSTHHKKYLKEADFVIVLDDGMVESSGRPNEVLSAADLNVIINDTESVSERETMEDISLDSISLKDDKGKLIEEENREKGVLSYTVYKSYWLATGSILAISILLFLFLMQASRNISDWFLAYWVSHSKRSDNSTVYYHYSLHNLSTSLDVKQYLIIYASIGAANSVLTFFRAFLFAYGGIVAANRLHKKLLKSILNAPLSYFDVTPIGRIINRFSSDTFSVDDALPFIMNIFFAQAFGVLGTIVITCYGIPWVALVLVPLGGIYYVTQNYYRRTSRELKRLSSVTLSPVYEHFSETISGLVTIRAFQESHRFISENERKLDFSQRASYAGNVASIWLNLRLNMIGVAMVTSVAFLAVFEHHYNTVNPGLVGLAISYALSITWKLSGLITSFTETEKQMICVERVVEYINETPFENEGSFLIEYHWPHAGEICFYNVGLGYRKGLPLALEDVNFKISAGEKIGICGRTGSGKSSLFRLLFKTIPLTYGEIIIDGVNIKEVMISQVRSQMSIIPQDPFLFNGSIADNLDPKKTCTSFELLEVLGKCHLTQLVKDLGGLDGKVGDKGQNLSCGQKQLLCLGRALLRKSKIICIDEATASVDHETDKLLQLTIRKEFSTSTVLTIAHRIETILDSDRVLVMSAGNVAEFAPPVELLSDEESIFSKLVKENSSKHS